MNVDPRRGRGNLVSNPSLGWYTFDSKLRINRYRYYQILGNPNIERCPHSISAPKADSISPVIVGDPQCPSLLPRMYCHMLRILQEHASCSVVQDEAFLACVFSSAAGILLHCSASFRVHVTYIRDMEASEELMVIRTTNNNARTVLCRPMHALPLLPS